MRINTPGELEQAALHIPTDEPHGSNDGQAQGPRILTSAEFIDGFTAPDFLIGRIIQRRNLYSLTAPTGAGKTAITLLLMASTALGRAIGECSVEQGRVLGLMGENPDDVRGRWMAMAENMGFDARTIPVDFMPGKFNICDLEQRIADRAKQVGGYAMVVADTSSTYFGGIDENSNTEAGDHARMFRRLTTLPGGPAVLVPCHPTKNATSDNLIPRGGGAFIAEVDGNLVCIKNDTMIELNWQGKLRGPGFEPVAFELVTVECDKVRDSKDRLIPTVLAKTLSESEHRDRASKSRQEQDALLIAMAEREGASIAALAEACGWITGTGNPHKSKVARLLNSLKRDRLAAMRRGAWALTDAGEKEAKKAKSNADLAGARY